MKNQYWTKQCGKLPVFQAIRYYYVTMLPETIYPQAYGKYLYNFYQKKKDRIS
jgi:hypothetical protein